MITLSDVKIIDEYYVGPARIRLIDRGNRDYLYQVTYDDEEVLRLKGLLRKTYDFLTSLPIGKKFGGRKVFLPTEITDDIIVDTVKKVFNVSEDKVPLILYLIKKELKFKELQELIDDPYIEDITIVGAGPIWVRHSKIIEYDPEADYIPTNIVIPSINDVIKLQHYLAQKVGKVLSTSSPIIDAELPDGNTSHRLHIVGIPICGQRPEITIRKKVESHIPIKKLIEKRVLTKEVAEYLKTVIRMGGSVIIVGPPGSGKTTLLRSLLYEYVPPSWKVVIIEDTPEIEPLPGSNWVRYLVSYNPLTNEVIYDEFMLAKAALRASVSKLLVIGETRGAEAQVLAQALNMGLGSLTTFHGGSAEEAIARLMSYPINLNKYQISMFWAFVTMHLVNDGKSLRRMVVRIDEPVLINDELRLINIYNYYDPKKESPLKLSVKLRRNRFS
ncbi:MAG: flagellar protein [Desulfurococcales archaeon ex4484_42]|nr:MAG: flagellar protein [Desulfurococcales archaeon ex4484_42]